MNPLDYCTSLGFWWPTRRISAGQKTIGCHSLAPRRITKAGLCQTSVFARFQNSGAYRSLSHGTGSASYESRTLPNQCLCAFPEFWGLSVALAWHRFCLIWELWSCMKGRIRFMTAITRASRWQNNCWYTAVHAQILSGASIEFRRDRAPRNRGWLGTRIHAKQ